VLDIFALHDAHCVRTLRNALFYRAKTGCGYLVDKSFAEANGYQETGWVSAGRLTDLHGSCDSFVRILPETMGKSSSQIASAGM
jgi:hypothetical protein